MRIHRVIVIILISTQNALLAPLSAGSLTTINGIAPSSKKPSSLTGSIHIKKFRRVSVSPQNVCGIDSLEDDYYGCVKGMQVNVGDVATPGKINKEIPKIKDNTELIRSKHVQTQGKEGQHEDRGVQKMINEEKKLKQDLKQVSKDLRIETSTNKKLVQFRNYYSTSSSRPIVNLDKMSKHIVSLFTRTTTRPSPVLVKVVHRIKVVKTIKPGTTPIFGSSLTVRPVIAFKVKPNAINRIGLTTRSLFTHHTTSNTWLTTLWSDTPRCFEKTIRPGPRVRTDPSSSTDIIWVGNTQPAK